MPITWAPEQLVTATSPYTYATYVSVRQQIALRLSDAGNVFWTDAEIGLYLKEALATWNAFTTFWLVRAITTLNSSSPNWISTSGVTSPRVYTFNDTDVYAIVLYHLMEQQLVSGAWGGTSQFNLLDMTNALDRRQAEMTQVCNVNITNTSSFLTANQRVINLTDTVLDIKRVRYVPVFGSPNVLSRADTTSFLYFTPSYRQTPQNPRGYSLMDQFPLTLETDFPAQQNGTLDILQVNSPAVTAMPTPTPLVIPNDWVWVLKWGVIMDMLGKQSESQDVPRQQYAKARYLEGLKLINDLPWLAEALFNEVPVSIESVIERDNFDAGWETNPTVRKGVVVAGTDLFSVAPRPTGNLGLSLKFIQNAPLPVNDSDVVQVPRDVLDAIIDYSVHLAAFKMGGAEFSDTAPLFENFRVVAKSYNQRISNLTLFDDIMKAAGGRQIEVDPRYTENANA